MKKFLLRHYLLLVMGLFFFSACKSLITTYDAYSYTQLSSVKVEVLNLIDKADEDYTTHEAEVNGVMTSMHKAMEYDIHKPKNEVMSKMWRVLDKLLTDTTSLRATANSRLKGLIANWKRDKKLSPAFASEAKGQIAEGFDLLLELESQKIKEDNAQITQFINSNSNQ